MKELILHVDRVSYSVSKKTKLAEEISEDAKSGSMENALFVRIAVEKSDEKSPDAVLKNFVSDIKDVSSQIKTKNILLYPYAHLLFGSKPPPPSFAVKLMDDMKAALQKEGFKAIRAPFGWYKKFDVSCKGHPLSELSRTIGGEKEDTAVEVEEFTEDDRLKLVKRAGKVTMSASRGKNDLKSNVELGRELDLYIVNEVVGQGLPLLTPKGTTIKREIERFIADEELRRGYEHTSTPVMAKSDLYKISGHWQHYHNDMFVLKDDDEVLALRPMTCPFQFILYKRKSRSYRDLPKKYGEISTLFRKEKSGELRGLTRLRQFTLADAHVICTPEQLEPEFEKVIDLLKYVMKLFGIKDTTYRFSKWDPKNENNKYINDPKVWDATQKTMKQILDKLKIKYVEAEGEAAYYGPKLDVQYRDVYGKEDTLLTVQIDFALPERFDMTYIDEKGTEKRPMIIHRSSTGATERVMSYLLEKTQGNLPTWLSPVQVKVLTFTDRNEKAAQKILNELKAAGIRAEGDFSSSTVGDKVRNAAMMKIPYIVTIGDKEEEKGTLAVKRRGENKPKFGVDKKKFIEELAEEVKERK